MLVQPDKGGNPEVVRESQRKRGASVELVDQVMEIFAEHKLGMSGIPPTDKIHVQQCNRVSQLRRSLSSPAPSFSPPCCCSADSG